MQYQRHPNPPPALPCTDSLGWRLYKSLAAPVACGTCIHWLALNGKRTYGGIVKNPTIATDLPPIGEDGAQLNLKPEEDFPGEGDGGIGGVEGLPGLGGLLGIKQEGDGGEGNGKKDLSKLLTAAMWTSAPLAVAASRRRMGR
jgi:hypothetical protein